MAANRNPTAAAMAVWMREVADLRNRVSLLETQKNGIRSASVRMDVEKFVSAGKRVVRGMATLPEIDRMGDSVDPAGGTWKLPIPLLWNHDHASPIGWVRELTPSAKGISVVAEIAQGIGKADEVWSLVESKLVDSFSIGFIGKEWDSIPTGKRFKRWEMIELSVVTIPAAPGAKITATRASESGGGVKLIGAHARSADGSVSLLPADGGAK